MHQRIALVGLPASGKTSAGAILAGLMGLPFADLDDEVITESGSSIQDIFFMDGEEGFREWERKALARVAMRESLVLATGGGTIETAENRILLRERFITVWLKVSPGTAALRAVGGKRPLLVEDARGKIEVLYERRKPWYEECAAIVIPADGMNAARVAEAIRASLG